MIEASSGERATTVASSSGNDLRFLNVGAVAEILVALMLVGGMAYTVREIRRLSAISRRRKVLVMGGSAAVRQAESDFDNMRSRRQEQLPEIASADDGDARPATAYSHVFARDHHKYESSWLARRFENEDSVA